MNHVHSHENFLFDLDFFGYLMLVENTSVFYVQREASFL